MRNFFRKVLPTPLFQLYDKTQHYLFYSKNPILAIFYFVMVFGGYIVYCQHTMPHIPGPYIGMFHFWGSHVNVAFVLGWFFYVVFSDPGEVTKENVKFYLSKYHFDNVLYERVACKTCLIIRPPRSKHCRQCNRCVARYDHHCPWIYNDVGALNLWKFIVFLSSTSFLCAYCNWQTYQIMYGICEEYSLFDLHTKTDDGLTIPITTYQLFIILLEQYWEIMCLAIFTAVMGISLAVFCGHTLYQIWHGVTTNETPKWSRVNWRFKNQQQVFEAWQEEIKEMEKKKPKPAPDPLHEFIWLEPRDLINTYDNGWLENFKEILFYSSWKSPRLRAREIQKKEEA